MLFKVVPTRSARVIADEVPHSNSIAHAMTESEMGNEFALLPLATGHYNNALADAKWPRSANRDIV